MALEDFVIAQYGAAFLKQIANPESAAAGAVVPTTPTLVAAANSARGDFWWKVGHKIDETNALDANGNPVSWIELTLGAKLAVYYFRDRRGQAQEFLERELNKIYEELFSYARLSSEAWAAPASNSTLSPTRETQIAGAPVRPQFDNSQFVGTDPWPRVSGTSSRGDSSPVGL